MKSRLKSEELYQQLNLWGSVLKIGVFALTWLGYYISFFDDGLYPSSYLRYGIILIYIFFYYFAQRAILIDITSVDMLADLIGGQILTCLFADVMMYLFLVLNWVEWPDVRPMLIVFLTQVVLIFGWTYLAPFLRLSGTHKETKNTLFLLGEQTEWNDAITAGETFKAEFDVTGRFVVNEQNLDSILWNVKLADCVFLCNVENRVRNRLIDFCRGNGVEVYVTPSVTDIMFYGAKVKHLSYQLFYAVDENAPSGEYLLVKRCFDFCSSLMALILLSPLFLILAICIKSYDHGPVFYRQTRLTKGGKKFRIVKFRSMIVDAEKDGRARLSTGSKDNRVTPIGKVMRQYRLDELPQLINILKGEMSVVGPRPERPEIVEELLKELPEFDIRLETKAGLTGYAQVYGKYNTQPKEKLELDMIYIERQSIIMDLHILMETVRVIFTPESTEGVEEEAEAK